jgi:Ca2+-binding EF-hand superfamily protein
MPLSSERSILVNFTLPPEPFADFCCTEDELEDIIQNFKESDADGDGKVTKEELKNDMKKNKVPEDQIDSLLEQVDTAIHFIFNCLLNIDVAWIRSQMFKSCDGDSDGTISLKEVLAFFEVQRLE